jgi:hypothetical protein
MSGQRKWLVTWARTVGMPIGLTDEDDPKFLPITQVNVKRALALRTFWIILHVVTCVFIIVGNGRSIFLFLSSGFADFCTLVTDCTSVIVIKVDIKLVNHFRTRSRLDGKFITINLTLILSQSSACAFQEAMTLFSP